MELCGERVVLRPMTEADRPALEAIVADPAIGEYWGDDTVELELPDPDEPVHQWVVLVDDAVAGYVQAYEEPGPQYRYAGMDIFLATDFQGRGLGPEVLRTVARWLFGVRGHHRLVIDPRADNERAIAAYERIGFRRVGLLRQYDRGRDGILRDGLLLDMLAGELRQDGG